MAFTDIEGKTIEKAWGEFPAVLYATVVPGDLLGRDTTNDAFILADQGDSVQAYAVALTGGIAGNTIVAALAAIVAAPPTGTPEAAQNFFAAGDVASLVYLSESGRVSLTGGATMSQLAGFAIDRTRMLLCPGQVLASTNLSLSGTLAVTGATTLSSTVQAVGAVTNNSTLTQTGVATFTAEDVHSGGINIATLKTLRMPASDYSTGVAQAVTPKGFATLSKTSAGTYSLAAGVAGDIVGIFAKTAYAHVVTAGAGITFNGSNNTATFGGAINDGMLLLCISATLWVVLSKTNITFSTV